MSLPIISLKSDERWDCHQCGVCCHGSIVPLNLEDAERLKSQQWANEPEFKHTRLTVRDDAAESSLRLAHREDGTCVFLNEDGRCRIHSKFGEEAKPTVCQTFPLQLIPHEKHAVLTIRRACPSAAADLGATVATRLPNVKKLVRDGHLKANAAPPPVFKTGESRPWQTIQMLLDESGQLLRDQRFPPVRRLVHALQFASHLEAAKTRRLDDKQITELARTLRELEPEESKPFFAERRPPKTYSKILLRRTAVVCGRLHPEFRQRASWKTRVELAQIAWKLVRGKGSTPAFNNVFPESSFEALEEPMGIKSAEVYEPLTRFIETNSESHLYALANRGGWSVIDSLRGLALLFPVGMWLLRLQSYGREPTVDDMLKVVVMLDRSQGYGPLSGFAQRQLISTISLKQELERLVVWYIR
ncbi:YkgJ family cysteine cluster protein [Aureliella helgolandensis]|uniref:Flagellin N-methylase n=1 Tax=Aureliella helgolandensis TaxID=2527968 RepID=A0A518G393_9BACT|nr:YkgJ family cysteine cluster protein [Aureliella helgolandensis]QDV23062.1 Flagellin N-methylase [Aureliella helgolandensis]